MDENVELLSVIKELYHLSGFRITVFDPDFNIIQSYPGGLCSFCRFVQEHGMKAACVENDYSAFELVRTQKKIHIYKCCFGLYEAVAPLYSFGTLTGYLMMGQVIDDNPESRRLVLESAVSKLGQKFRNELYREIERIPSGDRGKLLSCTKILDICSKYITLSNRFYPDKSDLADRIKDYLDANYYQAISIEKLCSHFFCSRTTVINTFKRKFSIGINSYLVNLRVKHACEMIATTSKSMKEIAFACGFSNQNYFSKVFIKSTGMSPTDYRTSIKR